MLWRCAESVHRRRQRRRAQEEAGWRSVGSAEEAGWRPLQHFMALEEEERRGTRRERESARGI